MLYAYRLLYPARPSATPQLWEWQQPASVNQQAIRSSYDVVCTRAVQSLSPFCERRPSVTRNEITQEIQKLTEEIRTLSYSSTKAAAEKILQLQQRRRELRAQLEAAEP